MINEVFGAYPRSRHLTDRSVVDRPKHFIESFAQSADVCDYPIKRGPSDDGPVES